jgi:hypothetical protein
MHLARSLRALLPVAAALALAAAPLRAQPFAPAASADTSLRIILLTFGQGDAVWERFGHNAIWVHDPAAGSDLAYNYGMFDFQQENFFLNFARGRMQYWMEGFDAYLMLDHYRSHNRGIWAQELNLTPGQASGIRDFLRWNQLPANRFYRYDYYGDNCSTRVRDVLDRALGGALKSTLSRLPSGTTDRWHTRRLVAQGLGSAPMYTLLETGLGPAADRPISRWEESFLPMKLRDAVREQRVRAADGTLVPLVSREQVLYQSTRPAERAGPPVWLPWYLLIGLLLAAGIAVLGRSAVHPGMARTGFLVLAEVWVLLCGIAGVALLGLWLFTDHSVAYGNLNLFQLSPLGMGLVPLLPGLARGGGRGRGAARLAVVIAALSLAGVLLKPLFHQVNAEIVALALPVNLALAWAAWRLWTAPRGS